MVSLCSTILSAVVETEIVCEVVPGAKVTAVRLIPV